MARVNRLTDCAVLAPARPRRSPPGGREEPARTRAGLGSALGDLPRALALLAKYADLRMGLVDAIVMVQAERHGAEVIVTTKARHFRAVKLSIDPPPRLVPLDA